MSDDAPESSTNVSTDGEAQSDRSGECFVIAPIGSDDTDTRNRTEDLLDYVIKPVVEDEFGLNLEVAHRIDEPGNITRQVMELLFDAELVIADLTEHNPNVMYELAVRHATGEPVVTIARDGTTPPFDIGPQRTKFYELDFGGAEDFKTTLKATVGKTLSEEHEPDNPIQQVRKSFTLDKMLEGQIEKLADEGGNELAGVLQQLVNRIEDLESQIRNQSSLRADWERAMHTASEDTSENSSFEEVLSSSRISSVGARLSNVLRSGIRESRYMLRGNPEDIFASFADKAFPHAITTIASNVEQSRIEQGDEGTREYTLVVEHDADEGELNEVVAEAANAAGVEVLAVDHRPN
jgi:hypothetical protein